jgi:hypothetical protein
MYKFLILICLFFAASTDAKGIDFDTLDKMPILEALPTELRGAAPVEQRGTEYRKFLAPSVKINVGNGSGSGTIVFYDKKENLAYVASCGHLWNPGVLNAEEALKKKLKCKVIAFYQNDSKLEEVKSYDADVIFYSYIDGQDTSLVVFKPDWVPNYFPIASKKYDYNIGSYLHSCGCDHGSEVAHYSVKTLELNQDVVTIENSPRPGRSGGGLLDDNGYYVGTCWGTQYVDGSGKGFFTPLSSIHNFWSKQKGYEFLLNQKPNNILAKNIPIKDRTEKQRTYTPDYILAP